MDPTDVKLLSLLAQRARAAESDLATSLGLSSDELSQRLRRIEQRASSEATRLTAFVTLRLDPPADREALTRWLVRTPEALEAHLTTGTNEVLLKLRCRDPQALDDLLSAGAPGVRVRTDVVLTTLKAPTASEAAPPPEPPSQAKTERAQPPAAEPARPAPPAPPPTQTQHASPAPQQPPPPPPTQAQQTTQAPATRLPPTQVPPTMTPATPLALSVDVEGSVMGMVVDIDLEPERVDDSVFAAPPPEPPAAPVPRRKWASGLRKGMPLTNNEKTILKALVAVLWADGRVEKTELALIEEVLAAFEASPAEREALRQYAQTPRSLDVDVSFESFTDEDRELLLTNAALMAQADGWQSPAERRVLHDLARQLGYTEEQARIILSAAVEENALNLPSRILEETP